MSWVKKFDKTGFVIENPKVLLNLSLQEEQMETKLHVQQTVQTSSKK
jgi:hypothetical protein